MCRKMSHEAISVNQKASVVRPGVCHHARNDWYWYHLPRGGITIHVFLGSKRDMISNFQSWKSFAFLTCYTKTYERTHEGSWKPKRTLKRLTSICHELNFDYWMCWTFARHPSPVTRYHHLPSATPHQFTSELFNKRPSHKESKIHQFILC